MDTPKVTTENRKRLVDQLSVGVLKPLPCPAAVASEPLFEKLSGHSRVPFNFASPRLPGTPTSCGGLVVPRTLHFPLGFPHWERRSRGEGHWEPRGCRDPHPGLPTSLPVANEALGRGVQFQLRLTPSRVSEELLLTNQSVHGFSPGPPQPGILRVRAFVQVHTLNHRLNCLTELNSNLAHATQSQSGSEVTPSTPARHKD